MTLLELLKDAHARATRIAEAISDGDLDFAETAAGDLAWDLWTQVERLEREGEA